MAGRSKEVDTDTGGRHMTQVYIRKLRFGSYVKLFFLSGLGLGIVSGALSLVIGWAGGEVSANIGGYHFTGAIGGVISLFLFPIMFGSVYAFFALLMYWPFRLALMIFKKVKFAALTENVAELPGRGGDDSDPGIG